MEIKGKSLPFHPAMNKEKHKRAIFCAEKNTLSSLWGL
jgi:hypothetical protein